MAQAKKKHGGGKKQFRFGGKQKHGHSRSAYFARCQHTIAANKRRRIEKDARIKAKIRSREGGARDSNPEVEGSIPSSGSTSEVVMT